MEVSNITPLAPHNFPNPSEPSLLDANMTGDMDIDMDIDLGVDPEVAALEAEAMRIGTQSAMQTDETPQTNGAFTSLERHADASPLAPEKVYIRGLDNLTTADVKQFASEHFPLDHFVRIEWIDDSSANIIYETQEVAVEALVAFSSVEYPQPASLSLVQLRNAKKLSTHPDTELLVRQATITDVKRPRAHEASRFYLLNPDKDPRERRRQFDSHRRGGRYTSDRRRPPRDEKQAVPFDESMYDDTGDDTAKTAGTGRRDSRSSYSNSGDDRQSRRVRFGQRDGGDLFAYKVKKGGDGRLRDRSASPIRDGDGRLGFEEDLTTARRIRQRSLTPPASRRQRETLDKATGNASKELFPATAKSSAFQEFSNGPVKELFPNKSSPPKRVKELFPHKTEKSNHRRTDAVDATDETADLFANRMPVPFVDGSTESRPRDLASRITGGPPLRGRLHNRPSPANDMTNDLTQQTGFAVRGSAEPQQTPGFSIRGAAQSSDGNACVKELFPLKTGGNELFPEKVKGRGGPRRKAEDMFS